MVQISLNGRKAIGGHPTVNLTLSRADDSRNIAITNMLMSYNLHMRLHS